MADDTDDYELEITTDEDEFDYDCEVDRDMEDLSSIDLVFLAMKSFKFVYENKPEVPREKLLLDIISWFDLMTFNADVPDIVDVNTDKAMEKSGHKPDGKVH